MGGGGAGGATVVGVGTRGCVVVVDVAGGRVGSVVLGRHGSHGEFGFSTTGDSVWSLPLTVVVVTDGVVVVVVDGLVVVVVSDGGRVVGG